MQQVRTGVMFMLFTRSTGDGEDATLTLDAALVALSARIRLEETSERTAEEVISELWDDHVLRRHRHVAVRGTTAELPDPI